MIAAGAIGFLLPIAAVVVVRILRLRTA
jgi:hypothetical protein